MFSKENQDQLKALKSQLKTKKMESKKPEEIHEGGKSHHQSQPPSAKSLKNFENKLKQKQTDIEDDEIAAKLFEQATLGVTPLEDKNRINPKQLKAKNKNSKNQLLSKRAAAQGEDKQTSTANTPLSDMQAMLNPVASEAYLMYKEKTLPQRTFSQLKDGKVRWYDAVDIHGSTIEEARDAVLAVIQMTQESMHTVCKIVHGKGKDAVLKTCVNGWLRQHPEVLAFVSAPPKDGGTGAVLVLLKRSKQD